MKAETNSGRFLSRKQGTSGAMKNPLRRSGGSSS
jgi:hypothetical protein